MRGIDVSVYQGKIDWQAVADSGIRFVAVRCGISNDRADANFVQNFDGARMAGLDVTWYHVIRHDAPVDEQYRNMRAIVQDRKPALPLVLDVELPASGPVSDKLKTLRNARAFAEMVKRDYGHAPAIYTAAWWFDPLYGAEAARDGELFAWLFNSTLWLASFTSAPRFLAGAPGKIAFWQHSNKGRVPGINADVDLDIFCGGEALYEALKAAVTPKVEPPPRRVELSGDGFKVSVELV